jgi:hypothetical protein
MNHRIKITNVDGLQNILSYARRRYGLCTRSRVGDTGSRVRSLKGTVTSEAGEDCVILFENLMRVLPRIAVLYQPFSQKSEEILSGIMELYDNLVESMPFMKCMDSSILLFNYYHYKKHNGQVLNSKFFSRRFMVYLDHPVNTIAEELSRPSVNAGAMLFYETPISMSMSNADMHLHEATKNHLNHQFASIVFFDYAQCYDANGQMYSIGKFERNKDRLFQIHVTVTCFLTMFL